MNDVGRDANDGDGLDDEALMAFVERALDRFAPPPARLESFARASHRLVSAETELADVDFDSYLEATASVRGEARRLRFESASWTIELEVVDREAMGQLTPPGGVPELTVEWPTGVEPISVDEGGIFQLELPTGPVRFSAAGPPPVTTAWLVVNPSG